MTDAAVAAWAEIPERLRLLAEREQSVLLLVASQAEALLREYQRLAERIEVLERARQASDPGDPEPGPMAWDLEL